MLLAIVCGYLWRYHRFTYVYMLYTQTKRRIRGLHHKMDGYKIENLMRNFMDYAVISLLRYVIKVYADLRPHLWCDAV